MLRQYFCISTLICCVAFWTLGGVDRANAEPSEAEMNQLREYRYVIHVIWQQFVFHLSCKCVLVCRLPEGVVCEEGTCLIFLSSHCCTAQSHTCTHLRFPTLQNFYSTLSIKRLSLNCRAIVARVTTPWRGLHWRLRGSVVFIALPAAPGSSVTIFALEHRSLVQLTISVLRGWM